MSSPNPEHRPVGSLGALAARYAHWLAILAVVVVTIAIVVQLLAVRYANRPANRAVARPLCLPGTPSGPDVFAPVHGCIVYSDGTELWAMDPNHPAIRRSLGPSNDLTPLAWSRDGGRLLLRRLVSSQSEWKPDLYVMNADGSQTRLTNDGLSFDGTLSPDGNEVAFSRFDRGVYVVDAKGGTPRLIARSYLAWWLGSPAWSPDGSRIAYLVYLEGGPNGLTYEIWTVKPDGTDQQQMIDLGKCEGGGCVLGLTWSPDGSRLAFQADYEKPGKPGIYVVRADGSGLRRIIDSGMQPAWSPDGSRIAFMREGSVFTMRADGSDLRRLEGASASSLGCCTWSPD